MPDAMRAVRPDLRQALDALRMSHLAVEDCYYSCPKSGECCNSNDIWDRENPPCWCGAEPGRSPMP